MQAELLRSLQLFLDYKTAVLDIDKLHGDVYVYRRDVLSALDDLRDRVQQQHPTQRAAIFDQMVPTSPIDSAPSAQMFPPDADEEEGGRRMSRLFSMRSKPHKRSSTSSSTISSLLVKPNLSALGPMRLEPERYELAGANVPRPQDRSPHEADIKLAIPEPDTERLHPAMAKHDSVIRHASTSTRSSELSDRTRNSTFSDEKIPVLDEDPASPGSPFPDASSIAAALPSGLPQSLQPAPLNIRPKQGRASSSSFSSQAVAGATPSPTGLTPDSSPHSFWFPQNPATNPSTSPPTSTPLSLPIITRERSNTALSTTSSTLSSAPRNSLAPSPSLCTHLTGRPEKKNNYWGFCKGAWSIRTDWRSGLVSQTLPQGLYGTQKVWQCKSCHFRGVMYGSSKPYSTDPRIHEDEGTGVRYRWLFLAKCHAKVGSSSTVFGSTAYTPEEGGYGCLFCSLGNVASGVYGEKGSLFRHIVEEHRGNMDEAMAQRAWCVVGRRADAKEDFDINIP